MHLQSPPERITHSVMMNLEISFNRTNAFHAAVWWQSNRRGSSSSSRDINKGGNSSRGSSSSSTGSRQQLETMATCQYKNVLICYECWNYHSRRSTDLVPIAAAKCKSPKSLFAVCAIFVPPLRKSSDHTDLVLMIGWLPGAVGIAGEMIPNKI